MFLDDLLKLADAQESTISVASTSYVDTQAGGDSYEGAFMYVRIDTAFVATGSPNASWAIETADDTAFSTNLTTLCQTGTTLASALTIGTEFKVRIPSRARRYVRGKLNVAVHGAVAISDTHKFTAGKFDQFITKDVDVDRVLAID